MKLEDFISLGNDVKLEDLNEIYEEKLPCNISFTSGTTGINKAVLLSHDANNALAFQQQVGNFGFKRGTKHLALVPPFLAFWDADIVHAALVQGAENIIELFLDYKKIPGYFKKYDINYVILYKDSKMNMIIKEANLEGYKLLKQDSKFVFYKIEK